VLARAVSSRLEMPVESLSRIGLFVAIAIGQFASNALARTAAESLFLSNAGAKGLPIYLILVGIVAVPFSGALARVIDRMPKANLYRISLLISVGACLAMRALVPLGATVVWFAVLIGVVLMEILLSLQFWVLITE